MCSKEGRHTTHIIFALHLICSYQPLSISFMPIVFRYQCVAHTRTHSNLHNVWIHRSTYEPIFNANLSNMNCQANWLALVRRHCSPPNEIYIRRLPFNFFPFATSNNRQEKWGTVQEISILNKLNCVFTYEIFWKKFIKMCRPSSTMNADHFMGHFCENSEFSFEFIVKVDGGIEWCIHHVERNRIDFTKKCNSNEWI